MNSKFEALSAAVDDALAQALDCDAAAHGGRVLSAFAELRQAVKSAKDASFQVWIERSDLISMLQQSERRQAESLGRTACKVIPLRMVVNNTASSRRTLRAAAH